MLFRSYRSSAGSSFGFEKCKIWEAARATSAAPFYFPSAKVDGVKFWDGGLENNNPIDKVWVEKGNVNPSCVVSLGTGIFRREQADSRFPLKNKAKKILQNLTNVEDRHSNFERNRKNEGIEYIRFDPAIDQAIGLEEYKKLHILEQHTLEYLEQDDVKAQIKKCAEILVSVSTGPVCPY